MGTTFVITRVDGLIGILDVSQRHLFIVPVAIMSDSYMSNRSSEEDRQLGSHHRQTVRISNAACSNG